MLIALKLYRCLGHGLKMCILFGHNPEIVCCLFTTIPLKDCVSYAPTIHYRRFLHDTMTCMHISKITAEEQ